MATIKNITTVDLIEESTGEENVVSEVNGTLKRLPVSQIKGSGGGAGFDIIGIATPTVDPETGDVSYELDVSCPYIFSELQAIQEERPITCLIKTLINNDGLEMYYYLNIVGDATPSEEYIKTLLAEMVPAEILEKDLIIFMCGFSVEDASFALLLYEAGTSSDPVLGTLLINMGH